MVCQLLIADSKTKEQKVVNSMTVLDKEMKELFMSINLMGNDLIVYEKVHEFAIYEK